MVLQDDNPDSYYLRFTLAVDAIFSPELTRLQSLTKRTFIQDQLVTALERGQPTFDGPAGYSMAKAGQAQIAEAGYTLATIEGTVLLNDHPGGLGVAELEALRRKQREVIIKMLDTVVPEYAFIAQQNNYELWHMGPIDHFPPLEPWRYLWSFMTYGTKMVKQLGRNFLETAPAAEIFVSDTGLIHMQPLDFTFHVHEHDTESYAVHAQQANEMCEYLEGV